MKISIVITALAAVLLVQAAPVPNASSGQALEARHLAQDSSVVPGPYTPALKKRSKSITGSDVTLTKR
ncbi:hypothetical protein BG011_004800, partial [Mortierella polycephala]